MGKSCLAVPSSSAQDLIITTANLLHFSAWHKMILTGVQHGSLLHLSAWHKITLICDQLPDPLGKQQTLFTEIASQGGCGLPGAAIWPFLTAYALGYCYALTKQYSSQKCTIEGTAGGPFPNTESGKEEPHHKSPKILVSVISGVFLLQEEW